MCRIDSVPLPQHAEMRIAGRLLDTWQKVISDRIVELHFERSTDFGQDVECNAENTAGADSKRERIPCKFRFQLKCYETYFQISKTELSLPFFNFSFISSARASTSLKSCCCSAFFYNLSNFMLFLDFQDSYLF